MILISMEMSNIQKYGVTPDEWHILISLLLNKTIFFYHNIIHLRSKNV